MSIEQKTIGHQAGFPAGVKISGDAIQVITVFDGKGRHKLERAHIARLRNLTMALKNSYPANLLGDFHHGGQVFTYKNADDSDKGGRAAKNVGGRVGVDVARRRGIEVYTQRIRA